MGTWPGPLRQKLKRVSPLTGILVLAVLFRLASALVQGNEVVATPGAHDQVSYHALARRVAEGHGFTFDQGWWPSTRAGEPTAHWSYLQVLYMAAIYVVFGAQPVVARVGQAVLAGLLQPWFTYRIGRRLFGQGAALAGAALSAAYGYFVYYAGSLMSETFHIIGLLWACDLLTGRLARFSGGPGEPVRMRDWVALGLALAIATTARQVTLLCIPVLLGWSLWSVWKTWTAVGSPRGGMTRALRGWGVALLVLSLFIAPFTCRNYMAFGRVVLLNTNAGFAFFWANHPVHERSFRSILEEGPQQYSALIPQELRGLNEAQLNSRLLARGISFVREEPIRFLFLSVGRLQDYFKFWPSPDSSLASNLVRVGSFGLCLPLILFGIQQAISRYGLTVSPTARSILLVLLICLAYSGIHLASWSLIRYRIPVDALLVVFGGLGLFRILVRIGIAAGWEDQT